MNSNKIQVPTSTHNFIEFLYQDDCENKLHFQTYSDQTKRKFGRTYYGKLTSETTIKFFKMCDHRKCSICISVNAFSEDGRKKPNLTKLNVFLIDGDNMAMPEFKIKPDCIVSRDPKHWHAYWRLKGDCTAESWEKTVTQLALCYNTDIATTDVTRVMRLPGFYHWKDVDNPKKYKIDHISKDALGYTDLEMQEAHTLTADKQGELEKIIEQRSKKYRDRDRNDEEFTNQPQNIKHCIRALKNINPAIEGANGDNSTFKAASLGIDYNLSKDVFFPMLLEHFNVRCLPPWDIEELDIKVENAYAYAYYGQGNKTPENDFNQEDLEETTKQNWQTLLQKTKDGVLKGTFKNVLLFLEYHPVLKAKIYYDDFANTICHLEINFLPKKNTNIWNDSDTIALRVFLNQHGFDVPKGTIDEAIDATAHKNKIHPVREYFKSLEWDGTERLDSWLIDYLGVDDTKYTRQVGSKTIIAAVARIFAPGTKFDTILILEGLQGVGKSMTVRTLASPEWFTDDVSDLKSKDIVSVIHGALLVEISELEGFRKTEILSLKAFLSRNEDKRRLPYERKARVFPRQCVFIGTTNDSSYLHDETGGRRFWPVQVEDANVDISQLKKDRDQLWAEAVVRYKIGEPLYITDRDVVEMASREQEERRFIDVWEKSIADYIKENELDEITTRDIWVLVFNNDMAMMKRGDQLRIAKALRGLGYIKGFVSDHEGNRVRGFLRK